MCVIMKTSQPGTRFAPYVPAGPHCLTYCAVLACEIAIL